MIADLILIAMMVLCIFLGYSKGLIKVAVRFLSFFVALIIALVLYTPISNYIIENTEIVPSLRDSIGEKIYNKEEQQEQENQDNMSLSETMEKYVKDYTEGVKENTSDFIAEQFAIAVVRVGTWIGLFLIIKLLMLFIRIFGDVIAEIPVLKQFNKVRRYYIWCFRRLCYNICRACSYKHGISNAKREWNI